MIVTIALARNVGVRCAPSMSVMLSAQMPSSNSAKYVPGAMSMPTRWEPSENVVVMTSAAATCPIALVVSIATTARAVLIIGR